MKRPPAVPAMLAVLAAMLLAACGDDDAATMPGGTPTGMPTTSMSGVSARPLMGKGANGPIRPCTGLDRPVAGAAGAGEGRPLPDLTLDCLGGGEAVSLPDLRGPLVLNVWASWCLPCRAELPFLTAAHEALGERVRFAGIALTDSDGPSREWLSFHGVDWPSLADRKGSIRGPLRVPGPPVTLFVNSDGRIAGVHYGAFTSARQVQDAVAEHLQVS